jgi:hypothetical protein
MQVQTFEPTQFKHKLEFTSFFSMSLKSRIEAASARLSLNQQQTAALLRISPEWLSKITRGHVAGSDDIGLRLDAALRSRGINPDSIMDEGSSGQLAEDPAPYHAGPVRALEKEPPRSILPVAASGRSRNVLLREEFQPSAPLPTREDCQAHVSAYLDAAARVPGGYAIALHKIKRALPLDEFAPENSPP